MKVVFLLNFLKVKALQCSNIALFLRSRLIQYVTLNNFSVWLTHQEKMAWLNEHVLDRFFADNICSKIYYCTRKMIKQTERKLTLGLLRIMKSANIRVWISRVLESRLLVAFPSNSLSFSKRLNPIFLSQPYQWILTVKTLTNFQLFLTLFLSENMLGFIT